MRKQNLNPGFNPYEIIFCPTSNCNLKCPHCFVTRGNSLDAKDAVKFLKSCKNIEKVGFSGGEPFLEIDFVCELCRTVIEMDLMFDNLMTNGVWWKDEDELRTSLEKIRDAGFDGKIGLSWDSFHGQPVQKIAVFINAVFDVFKDDSMVAIWSVIPHGRKKEDDRLMENKINELKSILGNGIQIPVYRFNESFLPEFEKSKNGERLIWHDNKWFEDDFCEATGQVLYVHANGNIAPCCGFANECRKLIIGTVKDDYETVMENASKNQMVKICYETGLSNYRKTIYKELKNKKIKPPKGKTNDMCQFCAWVADNIDN